MPLPLRRLHHVAVIASDYRRSLQFYTDVLGLTLRAEHYRADRQSYKADLPLPAPAAVASRSRRIASPGL